MDKHPRRYIHKYQVTLVITYSYKRLSAIPTLGNLVTRGSTPTFLFTEEIQDMTKCLHTELSFHVYIEVYIVSQGRSQQRLKDFNVSHDKK